MNNTKLKALLSAPFRPLFLASALICAIVPMLWILVYNGEIDFGVNFTSTLSWHIHEMLFGFGEALLFGFLLTASSMWTGKPPITGNGLFTLLFLWVISRVFALSSIPFELNIFANILFSVSANFVLFNMLRENRNRFIMLPLTSILVISQMLFLISEYTENSFLNSWSIQIAIASTFHMLVIMTGRLIPMFTRGTLGVQILSPTKVNNYFAICPIALLYLPQDMLNPTIAITAYSAACFTHLHRCYMWKSHKTIFNPTIAILHFGQLLTGLFFLTNILSISEIIESTTNVHFFTTGVFGITAIGMLFRVSKGHTGRSFKVLLTDKVSYVSIIAAFLLRSPIAAYFEDHVDTIYMYAAVLWCIGFSIYFMTNLLPLSRERA